MAADYLRDQRRWTIDDVLVACTGAVTADFKPFTAPLRARTAGVMRGRSKPNGVNDRTQVEQAAAAGKARPDVLTLSMGGNDLGFAGIIIGCLRFVPKLDLSFDTSWQSLLEGDAGPKVEVIPPGCAGAADEASFRSGLEAKIDRLAAFMELWYRDVLQNDVASDGQLVVVGYPLLFADPGTWPDWRGNTCQGVSYGDAALVDHLGRTIDAALHRAAESADGGRGRISYVSLVEAFDEGAPGGTSRGLCGPTAATWLNGLSTDGGAQVIRTDPNSFRPGVAMHSFHPNALGHAATARLVATRVAATVGKRLAPVPTTTSTTRPRPVVTEARLPAVTEAPKPDEDEETDDGPPITAPPAYDPGDPFHDVCQVAWPTAPTHTTRDIQITTTCLHTPGQFQFVVISYGDPDFDISPSRSRVEVEGTVLDIAESEYGFKTLLVEADEMHLT